MTNEPELPPTIREASEAPTLRQGEGAAPARDEVFEHARLAPGGLLGQGGLGQVWEASEEALRRQVAVKTLLSDDDASRARFVFEARIAARLDHPGVVPVYELTHDAGGRPLMVMKRVRGCSLAEVVEALARGDRAALSGFDATLASGSPAAVRERLVELFDRACDAVASAHARGVIHRDIKPANVMVGAFGEVLVLDWGLARVVGEEALSVSGEDSIYATGHARTRLGALVGTPTYMSPEQAAGLTDELGASSDVFSLGAMLYELLSLHPPYAASESTDALLERVRRGQVVPLSQRRPPWPLPAELVSIVGKAMARDPAGRYADVPAMQADLAAYRALETVSAHRAGPLARVVKAVRRRPAWALAALLVVTVVSAAALLSARAARSRAALAAAERDRQRARTEAAVQSARAGQAAQERLAVLTDLLQAGMRMRDEALRDFDRWYESARSEGRRDAEIIGAMPRAQARRLADAFDRLFDASDRFGSMVEVTVRDCTTCYWIKRHALGDHEGALAAIDRGIALSTEPAELYFFRGALLMESLGRPREAEASFGEAIRLRPERADYWSGRAIARGTLRRWDAAIEDARKALAIEPVLAQAHEALAIALEGRGDPVAARAAYDRVLERVREPAERSAMLLRRAHLNYRMDDRDAALADALAATRERPQLSGAWLLVAQLHGLAGRPTDASKAFIRLAQTQFRRAPRQALEAATKARALDPAAIGPELAFADACRFLRRWEPAIAGYTRALERDPAGRIDARSFRALCLLELGRVDEALADAEEVLRRDPRWSWALLARGRARLARRELPGAIRDLSAALERLSSHAPAWVALGEAYYRTGTLVAANKASVAVKQALQLDERDWRAWALKARVEARRGDRWTARSAYLRAIDRAPAGERAALKKARAALQAPR